ncbi:hypothetical protein [Actinomadura sp. WMMB 499]|uniref:hypothetical protein n=1 Tax=Actinomadura sp. WMMB 499 TaxID=1219491 RepID=UPI0012489A2E|nr:hypothetical protein [Actinomadura sp. WMMB 499]QFG20508.1 hypothetical protein F7P10_04350 [Actinomadura sp. WMMB 499]
MFQASQLDLQPLPQDLHYRLTDPGDGTVLADVTPIAVGEGQKEGFFKRFMRSSGPTLTAPSAQQHVPRVTFRVSDAQNSTLFFLDRPDKLAGNGCPPHYAVVAPDGRPIGYLTNEHRASVEPPSGPVDTDGVTLVGGRAHLRDPNHRVLCDIVVRMPLPPSADPNRPQDPASDAIRYMDPDGTMWARRLVSGSATQVNPAAQQHVRALLAAHVIASGVDERLHTSIVASSYSPPEPVAPGAEPYPGHADVHASYMSHQEEFIEWHKEEMNRRARNISRGADTGF